MAPLDYLGCRVGGTLASLWVWPQSCPENKVRSLSSIQNLLTMRAWVEKLEEKEDMVKVYVR